MNRLEELELTVQMLIDYINKEDAEWATNIDNIGTDEEPPHKVDIAESILASQPCTCPELPFPHKRTRACFRRY